MTAYFLDTSALVKRYVVEQGSAWVTALTDSAAGHELWICSITRVEILAALQRQVRMGGLSAQQATAAAEGLLVDDPNNHP